MTVLNKLFSSKNNGRLVSYPEGSGHEIRLVPISLSLQHTDDELMTSSNIKTLLLSTLA